MMQLFYLRGVPTVFAFLMAFGAVQAVQAEDFCLYTNEQGVKRQVRTIRQVPEPLRPFAQCFSSNPERMLGTQVLAKPGEIELDGSIRKERLNTQVGTIELRWPRSAESILGRTPKRAMLDAALMVSKTLQQEGFPSHLKRISLDWEVVFMDENVPLTQVPLQLVTNCHPAWMTPPSNIYVVAQRVVAGCGTGRQEGASQDADAKMAAVLAHEMGHALEAHILGPNAFTGERWRAEGFATLFERIAADYSSVIPSGSVRREHQQLAQASFLASPDTFHFSGTGEDYARASMYLEAVVLSKGLRGLMSVYEKLQSGGSGVMSAISEETSWSEGEIEKKARSAAGM